MSHRSVMLVNGMNIYVADLVVDWPEDDDAYAGEGMVHVFAYT